MGTLYDIDVIAWSLQQAALLRARRWEQLDIDNIVEEIESVGRAELSAFESRFTALLTRLLKWCWQPAQRNPCGRACIELERKSVMRQLKITPSLRRELASQEWLTDVWGVALVEVEEQTGLDLFADKPVWTVEQILAPDFFPGGAEAP